MGETTLKELWIYPVKSLGGFPIEAGSALPKGMEFDRRFMLVDENNMFITQRVCHPLCFFQTAIRDNELHITYGPDTLSIPLQPDSNRKTIARIWNDDVQCMELDGPINKWFTERLGFTCKLVFFPEENGRAVDPSFHVNNDNVSLADGFPYLLIGANSLAELNGRLPAPVPMTRFRPNFIIEGSDPFEEDSWKDLQIGEVTFRAVKPCARCIIPTIDLSTGLRGQEPLKTLATYRRKGNEVYFGQNLIALNRGMVRRGDVVKVISTIRQHDELSLP